jgi:release factor glutamine methyltransferase
MLPTKEMTLRQAVSSAARKLEAVHPLAPTASRDAELLLLHALHLPRTTLFAYPGRLLSPREQAAYNTAISRRLACEPVQHITGTQEFLGLALRVTPATLIPRPETELLVEAVLDRLPRDRDLRLADIGTGTGAIAIALAAHLPRARITAIDLSPAALAIARENAATHNLADRITLLHSDLLETLMAPENPPAEPFDAIVSNPPYVPETDRPNLHPEVRDYEPVQALFAGPTGLDIYRRLIPQARSLLIENGLLALEFGFGQKTALTSLLAGWSDLHFLEDLQAIPRVALARRPLPPA